MRAMWKGFISFGLVTIPVSLGVAQQKRDVSFRTLSRETGQPVKQKRWDPDADREVTADEVVKGYEVAKGRYVTVEDDELERFGARQEKTIEILQFVDLPEVDPVYYERAYWIEPQERAERPYALLREAMERAGRAAVGRFVLSTKEHLVLIRPHDAALTLETLYWPEDIRIADHEEISGARGRRRGQGAGAGDGRAAHRGPDAAVRPRALRQPDPRRPARLPGGEGRRPGAGDRRGGGRAGAGDRPHGRPQGQPGRRRGRRAGRRRRGRAPRAGRQGEGPAPIEQGRLRKVAGGKKEAAQAPKEAEAPKRRTRKAS